MGRPRRQLPPEPVNRPSASQRGNSSTTLLTVALAILLLAVGAAGYEAANLLHVAIVTPSSASAASAAAFVCDALKQQEYQRLVTIIDPAPIPPAVTGAFNAQRTIAQLQARDTNEGKVVSCATAPYGSASIVSTDGATRYQMTLRRANAATSVSGTLVLRQQASGSQGWLIERDSSFLAPSAA